MLLKVMTFGVKGLTNFFKTLKNPKHQQNRRFQHFLKKEITLSILCSTFLRLQHNPSLNVQLTQINNVSKVTSQFQKKAFKALS
jgi:hypothetical protein